MHAGHILFFFLTPCNLIPKSLVLNFSQKKGEVNCAEALLVQLLCFILSVSSSSSSVLLFLTNHIL